MDHADVYVFLISGETEENWVASVLFWATRAPFTGSAARVT